MKKSPIDVGEILNVLRPFAFLNAPHEFNGTEGEVDTALIGHDDVQRARALFGRLKLVADRNRP